MSNSTPYTCLYANLLPKFQDYGIPLMTEDEVKELLHDFLVPAIVRFHVCRTDLSDRNDEIEQFNQRLSDKEIEILSNYLLCEYIDSTYIRTPTLLKASLPSSDVHAFSSANMLDKLLSMHDKFLSENDTLLSRYSWLGANKKSFSTGYRKNKLDY